MNNPKVKILVDCHVFDKGFQGTRTYIEGIYLEFTKNKNFIFYLASTKPENLKTIFGEQENIVYVSYQSNNKFNRLLFEIPKIIKKYNIDYTHFQYIVSPFKKGKYIVTTHDVLFLDFPKYFPTLSRIKNTFLYKLSAKKADIKLTVSKYSKLKIEEHFQLTDYYITPNAVNAIFFNDYDKLEIQQQVKEEHNITNYIIYVSRWEPRKNHDLILKSFIDLQLYQTHQLLFIGDTTFENKAYNLLYTTLDTSIKEKIVRIEKTDFNTMITLLRGANASVYPTLAEGFGIPPLEAVAAKIPTLCSNKTAMSDFDFFGEFLFDPNNEEEFKKKLSEILVLDNSEKCTAISKKMAAQYNWKQSTLVLENAILENINKG
jgi:glycosyltransferase involved in cell wall biosynthesis